MKLPVVLLCLFMAFGCGKSELVSKADSLRTKMCDCKDAECAAAALEEIRAFDKEHAGTKVTKGDNEAITAAMAAASKCMLAAAKKPAVEEPEPEEKPAEETQPEPEPETAEPDAPEPPSTAVPEDETPPDPTPADPAK